jgi:8-oxo-dGTP pyrophosphatase MutT (NUDIX family)
VNFNVVVHRITEGLARGLPGAAAQARLAPRPRRNWPDGFNPARIRNAAGLLLVFPDGPARPADTAADTYDASIVVTVRSDTVRHGGQVSLPGGVVDPGETFEQAALREAHEEVGLASADVRIIGPLTPLDIPVSGFRLHPVIGVATHRPALRRSDGEVARIVEVPVRELLDPARLVEDELVRDGRRLLVPAFRVAGVEIWGATAMVLAEFLALLGWPPA